ncbi:oocyte zinc finger protein XlCOF6.1-like [Thalassophryne amazonica]|uniref:oocyte zinc finger protein XlCOF6.1-like n=1 Tax=Thalassophryne amazonica TaxID=390379 RepID=UPI001471C5EE|nr:oocyte zinc finger protein XlCOF6.1-like [Thalassophryne amazonica]
MSKVQLLRSFVEQRLSAAAQDICALLEATFTQYEDELQRRRRPPQEQSEHHHAGNENVTGRKDEVTDWNHSLDQEDLEFPHIKEEQEELLSSQHLHELKEFLLPHVPVKSENNGKEAHPSQFDQSQTEDHKEAELLASSSEPEGDPVPDSGSRTHQDPKASVCSDCDTEVSDDGWKETRDPQTDSSQVPMREKPFICSECGKRFGHKGHFQLHMRCHTGEKPFSCSVCGTRFPRRENLVRHMRFHSGEKPFGCLFCKKVFTRSDHAVTHMRTHTGEKPFSCTVCRKNFTHKRSLTQHTRIHTGEKPFSCSTCDKRFTWYSGIKKHKCAGRSSSQ